MAAPTAVSRPSRTRLPTIARTLATAAACALGVWTCTDEPSPKTTPEAPPEPPSETLEQPQLLPPPQVEIAGCEETLRTPLTCRTAAKSSVLRLYVPGDVSPTVRVEPDGPTELAVSPHDDGGAHVEVKVDASARALVVETTGAEPWRIALSPMPPAPAFDALHEDAAHAADAQSLAALLPRLDALMPTLPDVRRVDALSLRMLIEHQLGRGDAATTTGERALDLALRTGRVGAAIETAQVLAWQHLHEGDDAGARWLVDLQGLHLQLDVDATRRAGWHYYRGLLARHTGDLRGALLGFQASQELARRMGDRSQELSAATQLVVLLGALGRAKDQGAAIDRALAIVEARPTKHCPDALELDNVAWALLSDRALDPAPPRVDALFDRIDSMLAPGSDCDAASYAAQPALLADVQLGRALVALSREDTMAAKRALEEVTVESLFPGMPPWMLYTRGLLALREGRTKDAVAAVIAAAKAADAPGAADDPDPRLPWRLALLRGHAYAQGGRRDAALEAFLDAERIVDRLVGAVGVDQGREGLTARAHEGAAQAIEMLLGSGRVQAAAAVARRSRSRAFRRLAGAERVARLDVATRKKFADRLEAYRRESERIRAELEDAWRLDSSARDAVLREHARARADMREQLQAAYALLDEAGTPEEGSLAAPEAGELWLLFHPRPEGWAAFALTHRAIHAELLPALTEDLAPTRASELLLAPFDEEIEAASSVKVMPVGSLHAIDFAALPWRGDALLASRPVAWKLDVSKPAEPPGASRRRALVVGDPATRLPGLGRLPAAAREAEAVAKLLGARGFDVTLRVGEEAASSKVAPLIPAVELLHWAGHGRRWDDAWDSRLPLAGEAALELRDVLAFASVPTTVVLTGCDTGRTDRGVAAGAGGMHLAAGFVVAGASLVVAAGSEVDDRLAQEFGADLYADGEGLPDAGIEGVRRASLGLRRSGRADWTGFRAWVP